MQMDKRPAPHDEQTYLIPPANPPTPAPMGGASGENPTSRIYECAEKGTVS